MSQPFHSRSLTLWNCIDTNGPASEVGSLFGGSGPFVADSVDAAGSRMGFEPAPLWEIVAAEAPGGAEAFDSLSFVHADRRTQTNEKGIDQIILNFESSLQRTRP